MPSYIGTNFAYDAKDFLDDRISKARSKADLRNWDTDVPEGFEICLCESPDTGGIWYYYDSTKSLEETGHWIPRVSSSSEDYVSDNQAASITLVQSVVDTSLSDFKSKPTIKDIKVIGTNPVEVGSTGPQQKLQWTIEYSKLTWSADTSGTVKWHLEKDESSNIQPQSITITENDVVAATLAGNSTSFATTTSPNYWVNNFELNGSGTLNTSTVKTYTYNVSYVIKDLGITLSGGASYNVRLRRYRGLAKGDSLRSIVVGNTYDYYSNTGPFTYNVSKNSDLSEGYSSWNVTFNCNGGYHPYFLIPVANYGSVVPENTKMNVGGFDMTDFTVKSINIINQHGVTKPYYLLYLNNEQNGTLTIKY